MFLGLSRAVDTALYGSECHYRYIFLCDIIKHFDFSIFLYNTQDKEKLHYYSYVVGCAFFAVWFVFYCICDLRSRSLKGYLTKQLPVLYYIPTGSGGRWYSSGIEIECKGSKQKISTTHESDSLYQIYGDSVINHIVVRYLLKEPFPHVYYIDSMLITYK